MLRSGLRTIEAEIDLIRQVVKAREDPPHRDVLDTLGPARTVYLAEITLSGDPLDMAVLEALEPASMPTVDVVQTGSQHGGSPNPPLRGPRCTVCGKPGIERPGSLPICDECYTSVAGPDSIIW